MSIRVRRLIPNAISASRCVCSVALLFSIVGTPSFWIIYLWCGLSDMADGALARHWHVESKQGAMIDSIADLAFVAVAANKLLPTLALTTWMWVGIALVALTRIANAARAYIILGRLVLLHTWANKFTGALLFLFPFSLSIIPLGISASILLCTAFLAAAKEGHAISKIEKPS